jgi:uncharacterized protein (UPF0332 family)
LTTEVQRYLDKARQTLANGRIILSVHLGDEAGRAAYLAAFHAAQAFIHDRSGRVAKTHKGVHVQFAKFAVEEPGIDIELRRFLQRAFSLKAVADYEMGPDAAVPPERAAAALETANRFIDCIAGLVGKSHSAP